MAKKRKRRRGGQKKKAGPKKLSDCILTVNLAVESIITDMKFPVISDKYKELFVGFFSNLKDETGVTKGEATIFYRMVGSKDEETARRILLNLVQQGSVGNMISRARERNLFYDEKEESNVTET
jgi:hypothetical protein